MTLARNLAALARRVVGTGANNLVALDVAGKLPAIDGSQLINLPSSLKRGVSVSLTGTAVDFTGLPPGIQLLKVAFFGVSTTGSGDGIIQLGTETGFAVTGYLSGGGAAGGSNSTGGHSATNGLLFSAPGAASGVSSGILTIARVTGNKWVSGLASGRDDVNYLFGAGGRKELAEELTRIRLTTINGADVFDAGKVNIFWE
ncbi:hypothetical protein [Pleomorphomonas sp. NRK KF1]|uniref:hypothetical protein n=1 Tax=Pleomorphomonas sp. NRK KF1 TaxID=2943000 RepID=UPI002042DC8E|nr:hypothetical protein [Pleomorphomonas sp. NRK KF1]MCM5554014.1 hypothetical protein [Pleomorphomonas sp. NRK KF1]